MKTEGSLSLKIFVCIKANKSPQTLFMVYLKLNAFLRLTGVNLLSAG